MYRIRTVSLLKDQNDLARHRFEKTFFAPRFGVRTCEPVYPPRHALLIKGPFLASDEPKSLTLHAINRESIEFEPEAAR